MAAYAFPNFTEERLVFIKIEISQKDFHGIGDAFSLIRVVVTFGDHPARQIMPIKSGVIILVFIGPVSLIPYS